MGCVEQILTTLLFWEISTNQARKQGLICRLKTSGTSLAQYGPHRMIIAYYEKSLLKTTIHLTCYAEKP